MLNLPHTMDRFKAGVFDILSHSMDGQPSIRRWYQELKKLLVTEFEFDTVQYFYIRSNRLFSYEWEQPVSLPEGEFLINKLEHTRFMIADKKYGELISEKDILVPCMEKGVLMGCISLRMQNNNTIADSRFTAEMASHLSVLFENVMKMISTTEERKRYHELFEVTEAFNSIMDVNEILSRIIESLRKTFPAFTFTLLLSDDHDDTNNLPIEYLDYQTSNPVILQAFVTSELLIDEEKTNATLYAPLKGKQGVYGLLQAKAGKSGAFSENDKEFIKILSFTAGNALENAKLYEQSQRLIEDLQLINDVSHELNSNLNLSNMMAYLDNQISKAFSPSAIGFILSKGREVEILDGSSPFFCTPESELYIELAKSQFKNGAESLYIAELSSKIGCQTGFQSLMAVPMIHNDQVKGFCIVLHEQPYFFTFEMYKLLQSIVHHSSLAVANSMLREELQEMINKDHLTDLFARKYLDQYIENSMLEHKTGIFILIDIDDFKKVNDTYGHQIGDAVIIQLAQELKKAAQSIGIGARWGGEELALYFPDLTAEAALKVAEDLLHSVPVQTNPPITISCGAAEWQQPHSDSLINLVKRADDALYTAKNNGKNQLIFHPYQSLEVN
ncbi:sensor domain-containing diguanylate cyclase [Jeotgalibacillus sp. ET6]|uniref:sensor domain-containing diguanylate cyclase n=1 Tax=Jeotgalibacillus sp. ET6 TaxID=3037260 RepID=UPI0024188ED0|nr:sensor domain-containing diguanylate cyclase [Jeotgalibacillus sp. ET6]MDG5471086.1 sensor domain-containing diguanylate cyclase [Jeotgalibacillus sp. ET6]